MPNRLQTFIVILSMMTLYSTATHAEEDSQAELQKESKEKKEHKVTGVISVGGSLSSGNINKADVRASGGMSVEDSVFSLALSGKYTFSKVDDKIRNNGIESHFKMEFLPYRRWTPLIAHEYLHNKYKGYNFRMAAVAGAKYNIYRKPKICDYSISLAGVYDIVDYTDEKKTLDDQAFRISLRPRIIQKIGNTANIIEKIFYQPRVNRFKDCLIKNQTEVECRIVSILFLSVTYEYDYRSVLPPMKEGFTYEHHDHSLEFSVKVKL